VETVVQKYEGNSGRNHLAVENEPFLSSFGPCPPLDVNFFDKEIALVKVWILPGRFYYRQRRAKLVDFSRPTGAMNSAPLNYRYVIPTFCTAIGTNFYFFSWFYRLRAGMLKITSSGKTDYGSGT